MTARPQSQPLPGPLPGPTPPPPVAAPPPPAAYSDAAASPTKGSDRHARAALTLSLLIAVAGVSFSLGRLSVDEATAGPGAAAFEVAAVPAAAAAGSDDAAELESVITATVDEPESLAQEMTPPGPGGTGGQQGVVAEITDTSLAVTLADGSTQTFTVDDTTSWVVEEAIDASDVQPGDTVSVQLPFGGFGGDATDGSSTTVATQVTVTAPAA